MSLLSPQCPITTRPRSTPHSSNTSCWWSPLWLKTAVWVEIGTPVRRWARAVAWRSFLLKGVTPSLSVAHLRTPALVSVPSIPSLISRIR